MAIMHVFLLFLSATENNYFGKQFVLKPIDPWHTSYYFLWGPWVKNNGSETHGSELKQLEVHYEVKDTCWCNISF